MVSGVEMPEETHRKRIAADTPAIEIRMLGPLAVLRDGVPVALPASRKVRALFAYLALAPHPLLRSHLCELLWDVPNDPRGELRWCLSKIRGFLDDLQRRRVDTQGDTVRLDLADCHVDATTVASAAQAGLETLAAEKLRALPALFAGDFLDGLDVERSPAFSSWLTAQRRRFRGYRAAILEQRLKTASDEEALGLLEQWLELSPFDQRVHEQMLGVLVRRGQIREGEEHLEAAARQFEAEGLDTASLRDAWRAARGARSRAASELPAREEQPAPAPARRASIAVMPFVDRSPATDPRGGVADALAHDVITRIAKLRSLFVIAQGTVFALHERRVGPEEAGRMLNVDYVMSGSVRRDGPRLTVMVELAETRTARIAWAETFTQRLDDAFAVLDEIGNRIVASIASEIETMERNRAILRPPNSLDAWEAHHRGLWHMYRFSKDDNEQARQFFKTSVGLDPTFSRAYAGLSFTHWQNVFQGWEDRERGIASAIEAAGQAVMVDDRDPAAHWALGRALWLRGDHEQSIRELGHAIDLSPNFALGHYALAFVHSQSGDPAAAVEASDHSRHLSPFDPLLFAMMGTRAMALVRLGRFEEAADWGVKAAARPNAHAHIQAIAALALSLAGRPEEARAHLAAAHRTRPDYGMADFLRAMQFSPEGEKLFREGAKRVGLP